MEHIDTHCKNEWAVFIHWISFTGPFWSQFLLKFKELSDGNPISLRWDNGIRIIGSKKWIAWTDPNIIITRVGKLPCSGLLGFRASSLSLNVKSNKKPWVKWGVTSVRSTRLWQKYYFFSPHLEFFLLKLYCIWHLAQFYSHLNFEAPVIRIRFQIVQFSFRCVFKSIHFGLSIQIFAFLWSFHRFRVSRRWKRIRVSV